jgi:glycerophosphoryl diester phosphodiesterase
VKLAGRALFLLLLAGGLLFWAHLRRPREMQVELDLTGALPGDIVEVDVVVRRDGRALARHDVRYGAAGAPGSLSLLVRAAPGEAEVDATLVYAGRAAHRVVAPVKLSEDAVSRLRAQ